MTMELLFSNGFGGFDEINQEYVISLDDNNLTPLPWVNIIANKDFGCLVTESGLGNTWFGNSSFFRLTPAVNDPISEESGEIITFEDLEMHQKWHPTPIPFSDKEPYQIRHGQGYTIFEHKNDDIDSTLTVFVHPVLPIKIYQIKLINKSARAKKLTISFLCDWVLGQFKSQTKDHLIFASGTVQNPVSEVFSDQLVFCPDPKKVVTLSPGDEQTVNFFLGVCFKKDLIKTLKMVLVPQFADESLVKAKQFWLEIKNKIVIKTPNKALDTLFNQQLIYQTLSCRMWGKTGFYQPSGAFGFRDQIQDCLSLVWSNPEITRNHLILCARHQYLGGQVQHWWHYPTNEGSVSQSSDAALWLPHVVAKYIEITSDKKILEEKIPYLDEPSSSATLLEHCLSAIDRIIALKGPHGLPLILSGDWNDSLSNLGTQKKGESVWLSMFLITVLTEFLLYCDTERHEFYSSEIKNQTKLLEENCWDGNWFLRAFTDEGLKFGGHENNQVQIDSLTQSWAVICQTINKDFAKKAIDSAAKKLINKEENFVLLLDPPVTDPTLNPGYIREYPSGFRENGGAYNHAALFLASAFAISGNGDQAMEILDMVNPITHSSTREQAEKYAVEPYVVASDIYTQEPYVGHGGWTWYTGSASIFYMVVMEDLLGLKFRGNKLIVKPCFPKNWPSFNIKFVYKNTFYYLTVKNGVKKTVIDLVDDHKTHTINLPGAA